MLHNVHTLAGASHHVQAHALAQLFEPCPALVQLVQPDVDRPAASWPELIGRIRLRLHALEAPDDRIVEIISAHPRLGARKVDSQASQMEQKSLQVHSLSEADELLACNQAYEQRFPGFRYVVFVAGRSRADIMKDMKRRIEEGNQQLEQERAFDAMCDIALDRARKLSSSKPI